MRSLQTFIILALILFLASCQVKPKAASGGLISGHVATTNSFTVQTPASQTYITGQTISLNLSFPFPLVVTGTPRIQLTIGATTRYANYVSGSGTGILTFSYIVIVADNDTDGVDLVNLQLNGGTLLFDNHGVPTAADVTSVGAQALSSVLVDNTGPTISGFNLITLPGYYHVGQALTFVFTFSEAVIVTGAPRIAVALTVGGSVYANYSAGSGSTTLTFVYTIPNTVADTDGYAATSPMDLNGGTITDVAGNGTALTYAGLIAAVTAYSANVDFDGRLPYVTSITPPPDATYVAAQNLDVVLHFDRAVNVTGAPYIVLTVGVAARQANYVSGTGTTALTFRYTTVPGDVDADGIAIAATITQNAATIIGVAAPLNNYFSNASNNVLSIPTTTGVVIDSPQPQPISVSRNVDITLPTWGAAVADNVWNIGQTLIITVGFNVAVNVDQVGGTPRIPMTIGASTQYATYLSGSGQTSLLFQYVVQVGDLDVDTNIALASLDLNGGTITDASVTNSLLTLPVAALATTSIDGVRPTISSVTAPANKTYSTVAGNNQTNMTFTVTWSEAVNYSTTTAGSGYLPIDMGGTGNNAQYTSGNNTATILHNPGALTGLNDANGIGVTSPFAGSATIKDLAGNSATVFTFAPPVTTSVLVDTTAPTVTSVVPPANATYLLTQDMDFTVNFSESVTTNVSGGYPRIPMVVGATTVYLIPIANATATAHTFRYTVAAGMNDYNGVVLTNAVSSSGAGYVRDVGQNNVTGTYVLPNTTAVLVNTPALITAVTPPANATYKTGDVISFTLTYNEAVTIVGTPHIQVTSYATTATNTTTGPYNQPIYFNYASGSGTTSIVFSYTITTNDFDFDGLQAPAVVALNAGTINDSLGLASDLNFPGVVDLSNVFIAHDNTVVWTANNFVNKAAAGTGGITLTSAGVVTTGVCTTGNCRIFNGDDSLSISGTISGIRTIYIVLKTPAAVSTETVLTTLMDLTNGGATFDLATTNTQVTIGAGAEGASNTTQNVNLATNTTYIIRLRYAAPGDSLTSGIIIPTTFGGSIAEIIITDSNVSLGATRRATIMNYLLGKW